jgi:hypothetical protein
VVPTVTAFRLPKKGYSIEECEDAFDFSVENLRFCVADGATESSFADRWAQSLVKQFIVDPPFGMPPSEDALQFWLIPQQEEWHRGINWANLPWYCQEKAERGAYAAFLGMEFGVHGTIWQKIVGRTLQGEEMMWHAFAVGDSNMFQVREDALVAAFPLEKSEEFNSRPILLASNATHNLSALKDIRSAHGGCRPGDHFFLATDALSKWFLTRVEAGEKPWQTLLAQQTEAEFAALVEMIRKEQNLRNDDTTLVILNWAS